MKAMSNNALELNKDLEALKGSPDTKTKKAIAAKYGLTTAKAAEIQKHIHGLLNELHKTKAPTDWNEEDFFNWWSYFNAPTSSVSLKKAVAGESVEWLKFVLNYFNKNMYVNVPGDYYERARRNFNKFITGCLNNVANQTDVNRVALVKDLMEKTKDFHDNYMNLVKVWASDRFDNLKSMKDWELEDYMSAFWVEDRAAVAAEIEKTKGSLWLSRKYTQRQLANFMLSSVEYTGKSVNAKTIKAPSSSIGRVLYTEALENDSFSDIPTKDTIKIRLEVEIMANNYDWNKEEYVNDELERAEKKYKQDIEAVADKVRRMQMNEKNLEVQSIAHDPKHFDIWLNDGEKKVHARSIFAAEYSVLVTPHYRFIIT